VSRFRRRGAARLAATALATTVALAACLDDGQASPGPSAVATAEPTPTTTVYTFDTTIWYEGLEIHVVSVTATLESIGGPVQVLLRLDNPTASDSQLDAVVSLVVGTVRAEPTRESRIPTVPAGESAAATLTFELQGITSIDTAVIEFGAGPLHVAKLPVTAAAGDLLALEPVTLDLSGSASAGSLKLSLTGGVLRWDLPDWSQELEAGLQALTLTYDGTYAGDFAGGFAFTGDNVALRLPDGTVVTARRDGHSQSVELIGPRKTKRGMFSRFEIPAGLTGEFALLVRNGSAEKAIPFAIG
jgi:hypothetical protein